MDQKQLEQWLAEWQRRLRLQDWRVTIQYTRIRDMQLENVAAEIHWDIHVKTAAISIMDPLDWDESTHGRQDMESDIIHELIHLHYAAFEKTKPHSAEWVSMEQSINLLADALITLKRESEGSQHANEKAGEKTDEANNEHEETPTGEEESQTRTKTT